MASIQGSQGYQGLLFSKFKNVGFASFGTRKSLGFCQNCRPPHTIQPSKLLFASIQYNFYERHRPIPYQDCAMGEETPCDTGCKIILGEARAVDKTLATEHFLQDRLISQKNCFSIQICWLTKNVYGGPCFNAFYE